MWAGLSKTNTGLWTFLAAGHRLIKQNAKMKRFVLNKIETCPFCVEYTRLSQLMYTTIKDKKVPVSFRKTFTN